MLTRLLDTISWVYFRIQGRDAIAHEPGMSSALNPRPPPPREGSCIVKPPLEGRFGGMFYGYQELRLQIKNESYLSLRFFVLLLNFIGTPKGIPKDFCFFC